MVIEGAVFYWSCEESVIGKGGNLTVTKKAWNNEINNDHRTRDIEIIKQQNGSGLDRWCKQLLECYLENNKHIRKRLDRREMELARKT